METFDIIKKYLSSVIDIPPLEWIHFISLLRIKKLEKDTFYFRQGENVSEISFVIKGLLYNFYSDAEGNDVVKYFIREGGPVTAYSSLLQNIPAFFSCQTLEPTTLVTLKYEDLQKLYKRHPCWERMGRLQAERLFIEKEKREQRFLAHDATDRYNFFIKENPTLLNRIPQYLIASYLGVSPVSLSRIRKQS